VPGERSRRPAAACARWQRIDCLRKRLLDHTRKDVTGYLEQAGRLDRTTDWQFVRIIDADPSLLPTAKARRRPAGYSGAIRRGANTPFARGKRTSPGYAGKRPVDAARHLHTQDRPSLRCLWLESLNPTPL
jgi:hypothetical protein